MLFKNIVVQFLCFGAFAYMSSCGSSPNENSKRNKDEKSELVDSNYSIKSHFGTDKALNEILEEYRIEKDQKMSRVLTRTKKGLTKARPQSELTNLMADICLEEAKIITGRKVDFSLVNYGGIRSSVPKGNVTLEDVYKLMPFDNEICLLEVHRDSLLIMAKYMGGTGGEPISGVEIELDGNKVVSITVNKNPISLKESYWLATSDYLANGGDHMRFLANPIQRVNTGLKFRDAIIQSFERQKILNPSTDKRITYVN